VYCRILVGNDGAEWPLSRKFGCEVEMARDLMVLAGELGLDPFGLSFHVGSQQVKTAAYEAAIAKVAMLFTDLSEAGVKIRMVNLGGGYPVRYKSEVPEIDEFGAAIMGAMAAHSATPCPRS
jgi:ornithine decarboxylase